MMPSPKTVAAVPAVLSAALRPLPLGPLELFLSALLRRIVSRYPRMFERLDVHAGKRYGLTPSDLPFSFVLDTSPRRPRISAVRSLPNDVNATISGPLRALIGMADGTYDGDALFFSRTIMVEGDIEAVLALRNAVDDAGANILHETAALLGPLGQIGERLFRHPLGMGLGSKVNSSWS